jgi:hypothetical protein
MRVVRKKTTTKKKQKAKHGVDVCRCEVYVYYDEFKVVFCTQIHRLTCLPSFALGYCVEIYQSY